MSSFSAYLQLGIEHILDLQGFDHMLFIVALMATYTHRHWKQILVVITAFTLGHSVTLAISALQGPLLPAAWVELMIPITILITAVEGIMVPANQKMGAKLRYGLALFFGLIHGMGFSNFFRALLGQEADIFQPLLAFNLGVELGQLVIVAVILLVLWLTLQVWNKKQRDVSLVLSSAAAGIAVTLCIEQIVNISTL